MTILKRFPVNAGQRAGSRPYGQRYKRIPGPSEKEGSAGTWEPGKREKRLTQIEGKAIDANQQNECISSPITKNPLSQGICIKSLHATRQTKQTRSPQTKQTRLKPSMLSRFPGVQLRKSLLFNAKA